jgi:hypothetical protein
VSHPSLLQVCVAPLLPLASLHSLQWDTGGLLGLAVRSQLEGEQNERGWFRSWYDHLKRIPGLIGTQKPWRSSWYSLIVVENKMTSSFSTKEQILVISNPNSCCNGRIGMQPKIWSWRSWQTAVDAQICAREGGGSGGRTLHLQPHGELGDTHFR